MTPLKIVVVSSPIFRLGVTGLSGYGGLEQVAWETAKGLAERGHEVSLVCPDHSECPGVTIIPVGQERGVDESMAWGGYPEHRENNQLLRRRHDGYWQHLLECDVVIDSSWAKYSYLLKAEGRLKAPILGVLHAPVKTMYSSPPPVERPCFVCISNDQAEACKNILEVDCRVAHNGIDLNLYRPLDVPRTKRFLFLARFSSVKSPQLAIESCRDAGAELDLVGDTSITNEPDFFLHCKGMCDSKSIRMVGPCTRGNTVWWYSQAYAFIHPTRDFREPFGLAPIEAQACGLPVIGWDRGSLREVVNRGRTGILVKSVKEMTEAVREFSHGDWWSGPYIRGECREWASQFSVQNMVRRYEELSIEALDGGW